MYEVIGLLNALILEASLPFSAVIIKSVCIKSPEDISNNKTTVTST